MANYRKILVAYDGSASARNALAVASHLAREEKSWIKVLTVLPDYKGDLELIGVSNIKETIDGPGQKLLEEAREIAEHEDVNALTNMAQPRPGSSSRRTPTSASTCSCRIPSCAWLAISRSGR